jgi:GT2 family glycosyltransferase
VLECLGSIKNLDYPNYLITIVDNGSTDESISQIERHFPGVHIIKNSRNLGFVGGNNIGIKYALQLNADYILLLNDDTVVTPNFLNHLVKIGEEQPIVGILGPTIISYSNHTKHYIGARIDWGSGAGDEIERLPQNLPAVLDTDYAVGCALLIKAHVVRQIGLLDPAYFAYFEDTDWCIRCRRYGYRVVVAPEARIFHKGSADQHWGRSIFGVFLIRRNQILFMQRYARWYQWPGFLKQYVRRGLLNYHCALEEKNQNLANAVLDGTWAGLTGHFGDEIIKSPEWFRSIIHRHLSFWLWITSWLYAWDYHKRKRVSSRGSPVSTRHKLTRK